MQLEGHRPLLFGAGACAADLLLYFDLISVFSVHLNCQTVNLNRLIRVNEMKMLRQRYILLRLHKK